MKTTDPLLGTLVDGRYRIDALLARGGMASVYRGTDMRLQRAVAVKFIHPHLAQQPDFTERFIREARAAAALSNPHIVNVHDQGVLSSAQGERAYIVMELVEGPDLRSELTTHGSFTLGVALDITRQVLIALAAAHRKGIVHRDVKPENILLTESIPTAHPLAPPTFVAKVGDFGLARVVSDATSSHSGQLLGTVAYIAPEIVKGGNSAAPADIYAVGIMLYELIAGRQPFTGESPVAVAYAHVNEPMPRLSTLADWIPAHIDSLIAALTAKDPQQRPADGGTALALVEQATAALPPSELLRRIPVFPTRPRKVPTKVAETASAPIQPTAALPGGAHLVGTPLSAPGVPTPSRNATEISPGVSAAQTQRYEATSSSGTGASSTSAPKTSETLSTPNASGGAESLSSSGTINAPSAPRTATTLETFTPSQQQRPRRSKKPFVLAALIVAVLGALGGGGYWWFTAGPGLRVPIPSVAGKTLQQATATLKAAGFTSTDAHEFSDSVKKDLVIGTNPESGAKIHPSQPVTVIVSDGVEYLTVPNVVSMASDEAQATLTKARFVPAVKEAWSQTVPKGVVISQDPAASKSVPHDSTISIVISKGKEPLTVPAFGERSGADYAKLLESTGFTVQITEQFSDSVAEGALISVNPRPGTQLFRGDAVAIVVSKGPELVDVPNVVGKQQGDATQILEKAGFNVSVKEFLGGYFGTVRLQDPAAGAKARKGSTITITVV
ncbi:MAG: PASTA domain-containing protein [Arcanobacterium sp.]|nr:PASTA domain-containing protein [Arcanobacterium sp.]MDY5589353.1 PASTA domain-containing protein [Arcanobacterium sp.]